VKQKRKHNVTLNMKKQNKLTRLIKWTITHALLGWCAWEAVNGNIGAGRILVGAIWFMAIIQTFASQNEELKTKYKERGRIVPSWLCHGVDFALIALLVWHGWWFTSFAALVVTLSCAIIYEDPEETDK